MIILMILKSNTNYRIRMIGPSVSKNQICQLTEILYTDDINTNEQKINFHLNNAITPKKRLLDPIKTKNNLIGLSSAKKA